MPDGGYWRRTWIANPEAFWNPNAPVLLMSQGIAMGSTLPSIIKISQKWLEGHWQ
jgi:hypothetical protein